MTTTIVSPLSGELNGHDVQALRDFALEAPYEWRQLLTACADLVEDGVDNAPLADAEEENEDLKDALENYRETAELTIGRIRTELKAFCDKKLRTNADVTDLRRVIEDELTDIEIALEPTRKSSAEPPKPPVALVEEKKP